MEDLQNLVKGLCNSLKELSDSFENLKSKHVDDPLLSTTEAMAYCAIKDKRKWQTFQSQHKLPFIFRSKARFFFKSNLTRALKKDAEYTARKVYVK